MQYYNKRWVEQEVQFRTVLDEHKSVSLLSASGEDECFFNIYWTASGWGRTWFMKLTILDISLFLCFSILDISLFFARVSMQLRSEKDEFLKVKE